MSPDSENISPSLQEYFDNHYDRHLAELHRRNSVSGRMEEAFEKSDGTIPDAFYHFFDGEMRLACGHSAKCIVYMPDFGINKERNRKGKIIIEIVSRNTSWNQVGDVYKRQQKNKASGCQSRLS